MTPPPKRVGGWTSEAAAELTLMKTNSLRRIHLFGEMGLRLRTRLCSSIFQLSVFATSSHFAPHSREVARPPALLSSLLLECSIPSLWPVSLYHTRAHTRHTQAGQRIDQSCFVDIYKCFCSWQFADISTILTGGHRTNTINAQIKLRCGKGQIQHAHGGAWPTSTDKNKVKSDVLSDPRVETRRSFHAWGIWGSSRGRSPSVWLSGVTSKNHNEPKQANKDLKVATCERMRFSVQASVSWPWNLVQLWSAPWSWETDCLGQEVARGFGKGSRRGRFDIRRLSGQCKTLYSDI